MKICSVTVTLYFLNTHTFHTYLPIRVKCGKQNLRYIPLCSYKFRENRSAITVPYVEAQMDLSPIFWICRPVWINLDAGDVQKTLLGDIRASSTSA